VLYRRDKLYSKRELAFRGVASAAILVLGFGVRMNEWSVVPWALLALACVWAIVLVWLRSRGQIGTRTDSLEGS
jgi:hypothetical protein